MSETALSDRHLRGIAAAPGIAIAPVVRLVTASPRVEPVDLAPGAVEAEVDRFRAAVSAVVGEIRETRDRVGAEFGRDAEDIFDAQLQILSDPLAIEGTEAAIRAHRHQAAYCFRETMLRILERFDSMRDGPFKERAADLRDVKRRVLRRLTDDDDRSESLRERVEGSIVVVRELTPSDTVRLAEHGAVALVTERGGATGHAAIMLRARRLPAVMGVRRARRRLDAASRAVVDGERGIVVLDPTDDEVREFEARLADEATARARLDLLRTLPSVTLDGREVHLHENIELPSEVDGLVERGSSGVGLFRTEFFLLRGTSFPTAEEQLEVYEAAVRSVAPHPIVFRTMDLGGDKLASFLGTDRERNPFLGQRGIRFLLDHPETFRAQLTALVRASAFGPVRLLLPMITTPEELRVARGHVDAVMADLDAAGVAFDRHLPVGVMIETPAAVLMADHLAKECDFFSIGSNDLTQYTLAVDRTNAALSGLFNSLHPSVLRAIRGTVHAAHREGCRVSVCGEMAADPGAAVVLVGLGVDDLSMAAVHVPRVKQLIRGLTFEVARDLAIRAIRMSTVGEVEHLVADFLAGTGGGAPDPSDS